LIADTGYRYFAAVRSFAYCFIFHGTLKLSISCALQVKALVSFIFMVVLFVDQSMQLNVFEQQ
jgi:hypothetical protein